MILYIDYFLSPSPKVYLIRSELKGVVSSLVKCENKEVVAPRLVSSVITATERTRSAGTISLALRISFVTDVRVIPAALTSP